MPVALGRLYLILGVCMTLAGSTTAQQAIAQTNPKPSAQANPAVDTSQAVDDTQETPDDELDTAAVTIDVSHTSPLIQKLYQATRETKEQPILDRLAEAKKLLADGADVKAVDQYGRTALHWTIFGSSYSTKPKVIVSYEEIADQLIQHGVEINREDIYNDTALDYLLYSPNFEIQTLLIENGATSGFLTAFFHFFNQENGDMPHTIAASVAQSRKADLSPGQTLSVRLNGPVYSEHSRTGDPIEGTVTYPLCKSGENIVCPTGELVIAPGTKVQATVLFAQKAPDKYSRPRLVLDFSNIIHADGTRSPLYARVIDVDNARETVRNNEILGIIQPHASTKASFALAGLGMVNPIAGYTIKGVSAVYGLSIRREILFPAGTDLQIQVVRPSMLKTKDAWSGWPLLPVDPKLKTLVAAAPLRVYTKDKKPSDLTNLMFIGSQQQLVAAFQESGWFEADSLSMGSAVKSVQATLRGAGYNSAPVSLLMINGRPPDLVFQKSLDTFAKRHHIRIWKEPGTYQGRDVWIGAATHDIAISTQRKATKWSHRIDPHIDREREWIETDLLYSGTATSYALVDRPHAPKKAANATGDDLLTDGQLSILELGPTKPNILNPPSPILQSHSVSATQ
ncbi:LssY C-terminal domain-containing protein [Granulicella sp. S190]|uniref:LssY C-terminal domain-containing protein n=1 Tax=Granulicella sp. S190 TaxID=1747226 RepID=UPI00131E06FE|nr:LssY C-terminal domain-containing protein [Granulicella sp. S190]